MFAMYENGFKLAISALLLEIWSRDQNCAIKFGARNVCVFAGLCRSLCVCLEANVWKINFLSNPHKVSVPKSGSLSTESSPGEVFSRKTYWDAPSSAKNRVSPLVDAAPAGLLLRKQHFRPSTFFHIADLILPDYVFKTVDTTDDKSILAALRSAGSPCACARDIIGACESGIH